MCDTTDGTGETMDKGQMTDGRTKRFDIVRYRLSLFRSLFDEHGAHKKKQSIVWMAESNTFSGTVIQHMQMIWTYYNVLFTTATARGPKVLQAVQLYSDAPSFTVTALVRISIDEAIGDHLKSASSCWDVLW